jgi:hypothetical protein
MNNQRKRLHNTNNETIISQIKTKVIFNEYHAGFLGKNFRSAFPWVDLYPQTKLFEHAVRNNT